MHSARVGSASKTAERPKVFCIGLNKTGTGSFGRATKILGLRPHGWDAKVFSYYMKKDYVALKETISKSDAFHDWPWPLLARELLEWVPSARFVLTRRKTPIAWLTSLCKHATRAAPFRSPRRHIFGFHSPIGNEQAHIQFYDEHYATIPRLFQSAGFQDQLLEVCWEDGDGWSELCSFLDLPEPHVPFPHLNNSNRGTPTGQSA